MSLRPPCSLLHQQVKALLNQTSEANNRSGVLGVGQFEQLGEHVLAPAVAVPHGVLPPDRDAPVFFPA